jgi:hypothetical protein
LLNSLALQFIFFLFGRFGLRFFLSLYTSVFAINVALPQFFFFLLFRKQLLDLIVDFLGISLLFFCSRSANSSRACWILNGL